MHCQPQPLIYQVSMTDTIAQSGYFIFMILRTYNPGKFSRTVFFSGRTLQRARVLSNITNKTMIFSRGLCSRA